jgi:PAS domain-containing protein
VTQSRHVEAANRGIHSLEFAARWRGAAVVAALLVPLGCIAFAIETQAAAASMVMWLPMALAVASAAGLVGLLCISRARAQRAAPLCTEVRADRYSRAIVDGMVHGVVTTDTLGTIQWTNPFALVMFGYDDGELCQQPCSILVADGARHAAPFAALCAGAEVQGRRKDGSLDARCRRAGCRALAFPSLGAALRGGLCRSRRFRPDPRQSTVDQAAVERMNESGVLAIMRPELFKLG